jgi:enoyl-CoA hydratase
MSDEILFEVDEDGIAVLTVNREQARNALNWAAQARFAACVTAVSKTPTIRALIITGAGSKAFVAGADLTELAQNPEPETAVRLKQTMGQALVQLGQLSVPVIAAINGDAFGGGCEVLTACDLRIAVARARFSFVQVKMSLTTGWGGVGRLVPLVGQSHALDLMLTGRLFGAEEAMQMGLINRVVEEDALGAAKEMARHFVALPQNGLAALKQMVYTAVYHPTDLANLEETLFRELWGSPNNSEAVAAFLEKRKPTFNQ